MKRARSTTTTSSCLHLNSLSSGSQTLGINARPVPQVRLALPDYWTLPFAGGWLQFKGHVAYGMMTDDGWQHEFTGKMSKYSDNVLYHSKAGYIKIGNEDVFCPFSLELGLEMASTFAGTSYLPDGNGNMTAIEGEKGLKGLWHAFVPGGSDKTDGAVYANASGNQLGSWVLRMNWDADTWRLGVYADKFFEDHSSMFQLDYDGYGSGDEWDSHKKRRYLLYDFKDIMLGAELDFKYDGWINVERPRPSLVPSSERARTKWISESPFVMKRFTPLSNQQPSSSE